MPKWCGQFAFAIICAVEVELPLRITLVAPPAGVQFCLQAGRQELVGGQLSTGGDLSFDFSVRAQLGNDGGLRLLGPLTQGPPAARFVYIGVGTYAGQADSPWSRRIKVPLSGITAGQVQQFQAVGGTGDSPAPWLAARIAGTARDGGPACATVPLLADGWRLEG